MRIVLYFVLRLSLQKAKQWATLVRPLTWFEANGLSWSGKLPLTCLNLSSILSRKVREENELRDLECLLSP